MSGTARERCCCGATFEISAYLTSTVEKGIQQFRDDHAACRAAWAERHHEPDDEDRPRWLAIEAQHQRKRAERLQQRSDRLEAVADIARVVRGAPTDPSWHKRLVQALDNLDGTETP